MRNDALSAAQVSYGPIKELSRKFVENFVKDHMLAKHFLGETKENHENLAFAAER
jgi:hypothetical protein